jgi:thiol-disulfide isomerase/thioredoxin
MNNYENKFKDLYDLDSGIIELKYNDFIKKNNDYYTKKNIKEGLLIFYAPWCKHCITLSKDLKNLVSDYVNKFFIGVVNVEDLNNKNDILSNIFNIKSYPTYFIIKNNKIKKTNNYFKNIDDINFYILLNSI